MWRFGERKGKTEMLKLKYNLKWKSSTVKFLGRSFSLRLLVLKKTYLDFSHIQGKKHWLIKFDSSRQIYVKDLSYALSVKINLYYF